MDYKFVEFQNFGANPLTVSFVGTIVCSILQGWGLYEQWRKIHEKRSGKAVPALSNFYFAIVFLCTIAYGIHIHALALMLNGLLGFGYLIIYIDATRYPDNGGRRAWHLLLILLIPLTELYPRPEELMVVLLGIGTVTIFLWPYKMLRLKTSGAIEIRFLWMFLASASFWLGYYWYTNIKGLFAINVVAVPTVAATIVLWYWYARKAKSMN